MNNKTIRSQGFWSLGIITVWFSAWILLCIPPVLALIGRPHPFVPSIKLTGIMISGVRDWLFWVMLSYVMVGLFLGLLSQIALVSTMIKGETVEHGFLTGIRIGTANILWFHGILYLMVPGALAAIPILNVLPIALVLVVFLGSGAWFAYISVRATSRHHRLLRFVIFLLLPVVLVLLPHDIFRRSMPDQKPLDVNAPRLLVVSLDAFRRDVFETIAPDWKAPNGVSPISSVPATRTAWNMLLGQNPGDLPGAGIAPRTFELKNPKRHELLNYSDKHGLRVAYLIDDSLSPSFGIEPNSFTTVREPSGGWRYWFVMGYGGNFPAYSWIQNYFSEVETTNPWSKAKYFWKDVDKALSSHHWVNSHNNRLHVPIVLDIREMVRFRKWKWLKDPARAYQAYTEPAELAQSKNKWLDFRSDAYRHYLIRARSLIESLRPYVDKWGHEFPQLSGIITSDHGEFHVPIVDQKGRIHTHFNGLHGFNLDPYALYVPLHPFGVSRVDARPGDVISWYDLRDAMLGWIQDEKPLTIHGKTEGWVIRHATIRATHLENASSGLAGEDEELGVTPAQYMSRMALLPDGLWVYLADAPQPMHTVQWSTALIRGNRLVTFNPARGKRVERMEFDGFTKLSHVFVTRDDVESEVFAFKGATPQPVPAVN